MTILRRDWSAIIVGAVFGIVIVLFGVSIAPSMDDMAWRFYDDWCPVSTISATVKPSPVGEVHVQLRTVRYRGECKFLGPAAFEILPDGSATRVFAARVDGQPFTNNPTDNVVFAEWRFWPIGIGKLRVWMDYTCDGRPVRVEVKGLS